MIQGPGAPLLAVDLGKTTCRVRLGAEDISGPGSVGLAGPGGDDAALDALLHVLGGRVAQVSGSHACVAIAGHIHGSRTPTVARTFVEILGLASCAVTSDAIASHVGALGGAPGVVLAAGTGSVAVGVTAAGEIHQVDGVGQWLGDDGSGAWIGLEGLRAALRSHDGRGSATRLRAAAEELYGDLDLLPVTLEATGNVPQAAARFAPSVAHLAQDDELAASVIAGAARALAATAVAAARRSDHQAITLVGGLQELGPGLLEPWRRELRAAGISVVPPLGSALDGAAALAQRRDLPHERAVTRVEA